MVKTYLEKRITGALQERELIENNKLPIFYRPERVGENYRKARKWVLKHIDKVCITGLATAGGLVYFFPRVAAGIGAASFLGMVGKLLAPLDKYLYGNAERIARKTFRDNIVKSWHETYDELTVSNRKELDNYVLMAQTSSAVYKEFPHYDNKVAMGIAIGRVADILSEIEIDNPEKVSGLSLDRLVDMIGNQKFGSPEEVEAIKRLTRVYSPGQITRRLRRFKKGKTKRMKQGLLEKLEILDRYTSNYEFVLRISEADNSESVGSQLSRGHLYVSRSVGPEAACYAGMHSHGKNFPRLTVKDDAGPSLATHASRGLYIVGGDAEQGVLDQATGGIAIVEGVALHDFAHNMNDITWPAIAITVGGTRDKLLNGSVENGIVVDMNKCKEFKQKPALYRFEQGRITQKLILPDKSSHILAGNIIVEYILQWKSREQEMRKAA
jgi:hypothetical protein